MEFLLWRILIPMIIPIIYSLINNRKYLREILLIFLILISIVILYEPVINNNYFSTFTYTIGKILLFILFPILILSVYYKGKIKSILKDIGVHNKNIKKSFLYFLIYLPIMLITSAFVFYMLNISNVGTIQNALLMFIDSFSEEILFRGIIFLFLFKKTNLEIAYVTSVFCFILAHPQHFLNLTLLPTLVQGILTIEIIRRSENIFGAWLIHGVNRVFGIIIFPLIISFF